jgi:hypothetical protein
MEVQDVDAQSLRYGRHQYQGAVPAHRPIGKLCFAYFKPAEVLEVRRDTPKTLARARQLNSMLRQMWFGFRFQAKMAFLELNPKQIFIYCRNVYRIRPCGLKILTPSFFHHFQEVRNTAWLITVPNVKHKCVMEGWIHRGVVAQLLPFEMDFNKLTWRLQYYDGQIPTVNTETRQGGKFLKSDPGYGPWWAHNGLQIRDNDWDLNISYCSNQLDMVVHYLPPLNQTWVHSASVVSIDYCANRGSKHAAHDYIFLLKRSANCSTNILVWIADDKY